MSLLDRTGQKRRGRIHLKWADLIGERIRKALLWSISRTSPYSQHPPANWSLIPLGNLYALVRILCTAAKTLKANGVPVKFLIPDQVALARLALLEKPEAQA